MKDSVLDVIGIGAGPFNLSVAALMNPIKDLNHIFLERQKQFCWHAGMLLPNTTIQNSFLKDLVSFADPTSSFSFLAFLHKKKRLYEYVNAGFMRTSRREFNLYLQWVANSLPAIQFDQHVQEVRSHTRGFEVRTQDAVHIARNLVIATGPSPVIPSMAQEFIGEHVFHNSQYLFKRDNLLGRRVAVIGGGQSGAEIVLDLLAQADAPLEIIWLSARPGLAPIDESHFANEWFTPAYVEYFWGLDTVRKRKLLAQQTLASDGISPETIEAIYQKLYEVRFLDEGTKCQLMYSRLVNTIRKSSSGYEIEMTHCDTDQDERVNVDRIVLATGYSQQKIPAVIDNLKNDIGFQDGEPIVNFDFSLSYAGPGKIFVLNAAKHSHGISEPNLSVNAWRAAKVVNAILGHERYPSPQDKSMIDFSNTKLLEVAA